MIMFHTFLPLRMVVTLYCVHTSELISTGLS